MGTLFIGMLLPIPLLSHASENSGIFGGIPAERYLTGRFSAAQQLNFAALGKKNISTKTQQRYLHSETKQALAEMIDAFRKDFPNVKIWVASAHRSFYQQQRIWESKWSGQTRVEGQRLDKILTDPHERAKKILEYSAMPGASRHHWGTEVDFNRLYNSYYETGAGLVVFNWLKLNAARFGFCQPYTAGRRLGHKEEKWHWSYQPLATKFQRKWEALFSEDIELFLKHATFLGNQAAALLAPIYQKNINPACNKQG